MIFGNYVGFDREPSKEEIKRARETVVERLCDEVRRLSEECSDEFFIEKTGSVEGIDLVYTVGAKLDAITILSKE
jgi:hypothetical protein